MRLFMLCVSIKENLFLQNEIVIRVLLVRKDIDVNEHERLSNNTLRHKFKYPIIHLETNSSIQ